MLSFKSLAIFSTAFFCVIFLPCIAFSYCKDKESLKPLLRSASNGLTLVNWSGVALNIFFNVDLDKGWSKAKLIFGYLRFIAFLSL